MPKDKLSKFEIIKAFAVLGVAITLYVVVSQAVLNTFWWLVIKLFSKSAKK